jgi:hypothetical protein
MVSTIRLISRPYDQGRSALKNSLYRKATAITMNQDSPSFLQFLRNLHSKLEEVTGGQVIRVNFQNKRDSLEFKDLAELMGHLGTIAHGID